MMIDQRVISKLNLIDEGAQMGESFIHNCQILLWPIRERFKVYVMDCGYDGKPLEKDMLKIFWKVDGRQGNIDISTDAILDETYVFFYQKCIPE